MGVTDLRPYFTQIVGYNFVNVHRIPTKLGTEIRTNEPCKYTKFQLDRSSLMRNFANYAKRNRRKKPRK